MIFTKGITKQSSLCIILGGVGVIIALVGLLIGSLSILDVYIFGWNWIFQAGVAVFCVLFGSVVAISAVLLLNLVRLYPN